MHLPKVALYKNVSCEFLLIELMHILMEKRGEVVIMLMDFYECVTNV